MIKKQCLHVSLHQSFILTETITSGAGEPIQFSLPSTNSHSHASFVRGVNVNGNAVSSLSRVIPQRVPRLGDVRYFTAAEYRGLEEFELWGISTKNLRVETVQKARNVHEGLSWKVWATVSMTASFLDLRQVVTRPVKHSG